MGKNFNYYQLKKNNRTKSSKNRKKSREKNVWFTMAWTMSQLLDSYENEQCINRVSRISIVQAEPHEML